MRKILAIGRAEYLQAVRSKAFLVGLILMPVLMGGAMLAQIALKDQVDLTDRKCAVVDPTGEIWPVLERAAEKRNEEEIWTTSEDGERKQTQPKYIFERYEPEGEARTDVALSKRVRDGDIQGFVVLAPDLLDSDAKPSDKPIAYHTDEPTYTDLPNWIEAQVNAELHRRRFQEAGVDPALVARLTRSVPISTWGLAKQREDGTVEEADRENKGRTFGVPFGALMLLFMIVMTSAPQLMNQVLEEKMQRISEVLVSSVTPFELMAGKLVGSVGISLTLAAMYLGGVAWATNHWGVSDFVPGSAYVWFLVMIVFALLMYGSMFSALGAACSELRDAQSMVMPAMILVMIPMFALGPVLDSPNGTAAQVLTFVPTATPLILMIRILAPPGPPVVQLVAGVVLMLITTWVLLWASGKVFRVGVLSQGQTPSFRKLLSWIVSK